MTNSPDSAPNAPEEPSLAVPVGGNALNPDGEATHNPSKLGAGTPSGDPEPEADKENND
ncbi:MAG TPA: hypothetical protein VGP24_15275 [Glaciihabitans sp.]|nr:hypothetical protein [Glaciihabitans sp.]